MSHHIIYAMQVEEQEYFNWKCLVCSQIAQSPMHVEMQWLVEYGPHLDIDGSTKWVKCQIQSPSKILTGPYHCTFFRLQAVILSYFCTHLFIFISFLFSFTSMMNDDKKKWRRCPPRVHPNLTQLVHHTVTKMSTNGKKTS